MMFFWTGEGVTFSGVVVGVSHRFLSFVVNSCYEWTCDMIVVRLALRDVCDGRLSRGEFHTAWFLPGELHAWNNWKRVLGVTKGRDSRNSRGFG